MKITRVAIKSYRGIESLDEQIPERGAVITGGNARGKSSVLKAVRAALSAQDVDADAIRIGHEKAEILVDLDDISVRRVISKAGNTVTVTNAEGFRAPKPQTLLTQLLGTAPLDPLDLYLAKPAERRDKILQAMPCAVTREQLLQWAPDLPADFKTDGHGLEVIGRAHKHFYDWRTAANRDAAEAQQAAAAAAAALARQTEATTTTETTVEEAERLLEEATERYRRLKAQQDEAAGSEERAKGARARVAELRSEADVVAAEAARKIDLGPHLKDVEEAEHDVESRSKEIADAEARLAELRELLATDRECLSRARNSLFAARAEVAELERKAERAAHIRAQADEQEAAVAAMVTSPPSEIDLQAAVEAGRLARATVEAAKATAALRDAEAEAESLEAKSADASARAATLDRAVKALAKDAPAAVLAAAQAIPGLTLEGTDVYLDGVRLEARSGAEQMRFAVEIAKRLNAKTRILVVDGLERLDPDQREEFVRAATADDWQLLATLVDRGEAVFAAIEPDAAAEQEPTQEVAAL